MTGHNSMELNDYQRLAMKTADTRPPSESQIINATLGLNGEAGEVAEVVKKMLYHGHDADESIGKVKKELGDCLFYIAWMADIFGWNLSDVATSNIRKLAARYPEGFSVERSVNRPEGHDDGSTSKPDKGE